MREPKCGAGAQCCILRNSFQPCPGKPQESYMSWLLLSHPESSVPCHCWPALCHPVPRAAPVPA